MILTRIARALQKQDWVVVAIEIAVVVLGIFIGLRVDDWNEARKHRMEEALYIAQIIDDLEAMRIDINEEAETRRQRFETMARALDALETCTDTEEAIADLGFTFAIYQVANSIKILDAAYEEMRRSGALARIADPVLKQQLVYTFAGLNRTGAYMTSFRASMPVVDAIVWENVTYSLREGKDGRLRQAASFDMDELCSSRPVHNAIVEMVDIQKDGYGYFIDMLALVDDLVVSLDAYTGRQRGQ